LLLLLLLLLLPPLVAAALVSLLNRFQDAKPNVKSKAASACDHRLAEATPAHLHLVLQVTIDTPPVVLQPPTSASHQTRSPQKTLTLN
jgi:hypothetical protein